jgi:hypothetical protein
MAGCPSAQPHNVVNCILDNTKVFAKVYELDPLVAARFCK